MVEFPVATVGKVRHAPLHGSTASGLVAFVMRRVKMMVRPLASAAARLPSD